MTAILCALMYVAIPIAVAKLLAWPLSFFPKIVHHAAVMILTLIGWFLVAFN